MEKGSGMGGVVKWGRGVGLWVGWGCGIVGWNGVMGGWGYGVQ